MMPKGFEAAERFHGFRDLERLRNDEVYMDALGAQRIPDPTTAGDFCRRFKPNDVEALMDAKAYQDFVESEAK